MSAGKPHLLVRRWRLIAAAAMGVAGVLWSRAHGLPPGLSGLVGWNAACLLFLTTTLWMLFRDDEATVRARAAYDDEGQTITTLIVLAAVAASLAAAVLAMHESRAAGVDTAARTWALILSVSTLLLGWLVLQTVFTLRYAHRYFGDGNQDGKVDGGVNYPGDPPRTYHDFIYLAVCVGATAQVSDVDVTSARFRRLVTQHALTAFFFNTMVVALGINILATVIGQ